MKKKIKEVQDYFKAKLLAGKFKVANITEFGLTLSVDNEYEFQMWIGNPDIPDTRRLCGENNFLNIMFNQKERIKMHSVTKRYVTEYRKKSLLKDKQEKLRRLQKEIKKLKP